MWPTTCSHNISDDDDHICHLDHLKMSRSSIISGRVTAWMDHLQRGPLTPGAHSQEGSTPEGSTQGRVRPWIDHFGRGPLTDAYILITPSFFYYILITLSFFVLNYILVVTLSNIYFSNYILITLSKIFVQLNFSYTVKNICLNYILITLSKKAGVHSQ